MPPCYRFKFSCNLFYGLQKEPYVVKNKDVRMRLISPFVDLRLKIGGELFFKRMIERKTVIMKRLVNGAAEKRRFELWIRHKEVTPVRQVLPVTFDQSEQNHHQNRCV